MTRSHFLPSLRGFFRRQALQWSLIGLGLTLVFAIVCILYGAKLGAEKQVLALARTAAGSYRQTLLEGDVRAAEFQMRGDLGLKADESVLVLDPAFRVVYPLRDSDKAVLCKAPSRFCWSKGFRTVTTLYPIYFDPDQGKSLFGYLEVTVKPLVDWRVLSLLVFLALAAFVVQAFGLLSALNDSADIVTLRLQEWAHHISHSPSGPADALTSAPFSELAPMQGAISGLQHEIARLEARTAQEAKRVAQLSILREVGHDLKTPLSQLGKFLTLHFEKLKRQGQLDEMESARIERILKRAGDLVRQLKITQSAASIAGFASDALCDLGSETRVIVADLAHITEIECKRIRLDLDIREGVGAAGIPKARYYQILENIVRNAAQALPEEGGAIVVTVIEESGRPTLSVKDNGPGIPSNIQNRIFDFDFTTKPGQGTGLGLGIVKRICEESRAEIRFKSFPGQGTEFAVSFQPATVRQYEEVHHNANPSL